MPSEASTSPRKLPRQERSRETVEAILGAMARVLKKDGYDRASTNRVARVAGVSIGSLYQYFPNKESLVTALYERHLEQIMAAAGSKLRALAGAPLTTAVRELVEASIELHAVDPELHRVLVEQAPRVGRSERGDALEAEIMASMRAYLEEHEAEIHPKNIELAAFVVVRAVESLTHAAVLERPEYLKDGQLVEEITTLVLNYLSPAGRSHT